jgi:hypothetical protein
MLIFSYERVPTQQTWIIRLKSKQVLFDLLKPINIRLCMRIPQRNIWLSDDCTAVIGQILFLPVCQGTTGRQGAFIGLICFLENDISLQFLTNC